MIKILRITLCFVIFGLLSSSCSTEKQTSLQDPNTILDLSGSWHFQLDSLNIGIKNKWYSKKQTDSIVLPTTTDVAKKGILNTNVQSGRFTRLYPYYGPAWYQKEINVPEEWGRKELFLFMELTKASKVWIDDHFIGEEISLTAPHSYNLSKFLSPGKHLLSVRIDNSDNPPVGWPHQISDQTQTNWNGILGRLELQVKDPIWMTAVKVYPDIHKKKVDIIVSFNKKSSGTLIIQANSWNSNKKHTINSKEIVFETRDANEFKTSVSIGDDMQLWDEFNPALYKLKLLFKGQSNGKEIKDFKEVDFGMREFTTKGTQFNVNGKTVFLRGKHESHVFPLTGHVPMQVKEWIKIFKIAKTYGVNHYRYHTCVPSEAAFSAADIVGIYLEPQLPRWGQVGDSENSISLEDVEIKKDESNQTELVNYMVFEGFKILETFGNHASFCMFSLGNELHGDRKIIAEMVSKFKTSDKRHLYASGSNNFLWEPKLSPGDDFWATTFTGGHYTFGNYYPDTKGLDTRSSYPVHTIGQINNVYPNTNYTYSSGIKDIPVPVISHENGQFQVYPNFNEIKKFTGVVRAKNYETYKERLTKAGMLDQADDFFKASGALAALCYRADIETAIRTKGFGGFQLLDLQDFPGQGTALVGMLDVFMDSKGIITPEKWREFCNDVVPLLKMEKYTWTTDEAFTGQLSIANYGANTLDTDLHWQVINAQGKVEIEGKTKVKSVQGTVTDFNALNIDLSKIAAPQKLEIKLVVEGSKAKNSYPIWLYPSKVNTVAPKEIKIATSLDRETISTLEKGGKVLLLPNEELLTNYIGGAFQSDFWCYPMFKKYSPPGTLGILCNPKHPIFNAFPTDYHSNWQWWAMLKNGKSMILDSTAADFRPIVQVVDNFERNHKLGVIFECRIGKGKLLICSSNLDQQYPEAKQLLHSILNYMNSTAFVPKDDLHLQDVRVILSK